ncbi:MAG: cobalt-precorrin-5B (C(1))-methyltransferase [Nitratireductor sp.]|nr:cobalt-precorrin-5B (C(1))-methyltransferase [Nitratireductor sp.]
MNKVQRQEKPAAESALRRGWTTGACATAATKAALTALLTGRFPDPVSITLPRGETPAFALARETLEAGRATAAIIKDAGDDPDVTHGALVTVTVARGKPGTGITFHAGKGVGTVTKPGLPIAPGEAAINPVPRRMMREVAETLCAEHAIAPDIAITIAVPGGEEMARHTWNPRLGIVGGISILGTTGIVHPFSCSAWIHSIHRGIDVCRANGLHHALAATGSTSEDAANAIYKLPLEALLDMGDFAGGVLKYLRQNPIDRLTLAGGFAKFAKLANGAMDLHSGRSQVDMDWLAGRAAGLGLSDRKTAAIRTANTAMEALEIAGSDIDLPGHIAALARDQALAVLRGAPVAVEVMVFTRDGRLLARTGAFDG